MTNHHNTANTHACAKLSYGRKYVHLHQFVIHKFVAHSPVPPTYHHLDTSLYIVRHGSLLACCACSSVKECLVGQYTIGCPYGDWWGNGWKCQHSELMWVRVFSSSSHVWHMRGYFQCHSNLARVRTDAFSNRVSISKQRPSFFKHIMIASPLSFACWQGTRSTYVFDTINGVPQFRLEALLLSW